MPSHHTLNRRCHGLKAQRQPKICVLVSDYAGTHSISVVDIKFSETSVHAIEYQLRFFIIHVKEPTRKFGVELPASGTAQVPTYSRTTFRNQGIKNVSKNRCINRHRLSDHVHAQCRAGGR